MSKEVKQVIIIRNDTVPKMRNGKAIAQGAHASLAVILEYFLGSYENRNWIIDKESNKVKANIEFDIDSPLYIWLSTIFTKVVVQGTLAELNEAYEKAKKEGIPCSIIEDRGLTEFSGKKTITAVAIGPDYSEKIDTITKTFKLA